MRYLGEESVSEAIADNLKHKSIYGFTEIRFNERHWNPEFTGQDDLLYIHLPEDIDVQVTVLRSQGLNLISTFLP